MSWRSLSFADFPACPAPPCLQYVVGLIVGAFQGLVVLFYQWVVDPAEHGTW
jgi:hypothetical protein